MSGNARRGAGLFARIMAVVLAVILLLTAACVTISLLVMRSERITDQLEALKKEAREIAYLASRSSSYTDAFFFGGESAATRLLGWKAQQVYESFGAYILVVDRNGYLMDNLVFARAQDPDFTGSLNADELAQLLARVLQGEEIAIRTAIGGNPAFTVGVPFVQEERVLGAVLIRTKAQTVESSAGGLAWPIALAALAVMLLAALVLSLCLRSALRPLRKVTEAARAMSGGDFTRRVEGFAGTREVAELAEAFNLMSEKLGEVEESRREFVANVSHELRSPITSISGFIGGMADGTIPPEEHPRYLKLVYGETQRLAKLVGDLLALSRMERGTARLNLTSFDLCSLFRAAVVRRVSDLEGRHMDVVCDFPDDPCPVLADRDRIEEVIINLVDNAVKFTPEGGTLTLSAKKSGGTVTAVVRDNGPGILPEDRPRVFERFFTADRAHTAGKGTGLGLSICQRIMEMHGESIRLLDTEEGAAFAFTLKAAPASGSGSHSGGTA